MFDTPLVQNLPPPSEVRTRLTDAVREVTLLRRLLRLAKSAEEFRQISQHNGRIVEGGSRAAS
jgi:hypothetical protein